MVCGFSVEGLGIIAPLKKIEYRIYGDLIIHNVRKAIFHLLKGDYRA